MEKSEFKSLLKEIRSELNMNKNMLDKVLNEEMVEEKPNDVEIQTTFNEDSMDVLCEDAEVENENKEGE